MSGQWWESNLIVGPFSNITEANAWAAANPSSLFLGLLATIGGVPYSWGGTAWDAVGNSFFPIGAHSKTLYGDVAIGDSITTNGGYASWFDFLCIFSMGRLQCIANKGVGGNKIQDMINRFDSDVGTLRPARVHIMAGTNDWPSYLSPTDADAYMNKFDTLVQKAVSLGATPFIYAMPPKTSYIRQISEGNLRYSEYCRKRGYQFINPWYSLIDPTTGTWATGNSGDGTHPQLYLANVVAQNALTQIVLPQESVRLPFGLTDGLCVSPIPTAITNPYGASAASCTPSLVAPSAGDFGNWSRQTIAGATGIVQFSAANNAVISDGASSIALGDTILMAFRLRISGATNNARWQVRFGTGHNGTMPNSSGGIGNVDGIFFVKFTATSAGSNTQTHPQFWCTTTNASAYSMVIDVAQVGVWNLTKLQGSV